MATTNCTLAGTTYNLHYFKSSTNEGQHYQGILFTLPPFQFNYTILADDTIIFSPLNTEKYRQDAIIHSVAQHEEKSADGGFVP